MRREFRASPGGCASRLTCVGEARSVSVWLLSGRWTTNSVEVTTALWKHVALTAASAAGGSAKVW